MRASSLPAALVLLASPALAEAPAELPNRPILAAIQDAFVAIAEELRPAVVTVAAPRPSHPGGEGVDSRGRSSRAVSTGSGVILSADRMDPHE